MILLTSFERSRVISAMEKWSGAVYQPKGFGYPKARWADIRDDSGLWIRPREFVEEKRPLIAYRQTLLDLYQSREDKTWEWLEKVQPLENRHRKVALCCWCPYERAAQRQLNQWGSYVCHLSVVGEFLADLGAEVWYDSDRLQMAVLTQAGLPVGTPR